MPLLRWSSTTASALLRPLSSGRAGTRFRPSDAGRVRCAARPIGSTCRHARHALLASRTRLAELASGRVTVVASLKRRPRASKYCWLGRTPTRSSGLRHARQCHATGRLNLSLRAVPPIGHRPARSTLGARSECGGSSGSSEFRRAVRSTFMHTRVCRLHSSTDRPPTQLFGSRASASFAGKPG